MNLTAPNDFIISGNNLDKNKWIFKFNDVIINDQAITVTAKLIHINYTLTDADRLKPKGTLTVLSGGDKADYTKEWDIPQP